MNLSAGTLWECTSLFYGYTICIHGIKLSRVELSCPSEQLVELSCPCGIKLSFF